MIPMLSTYIKKNNITVMWENICWCYEAIIKDGGGPLSRDMQLDFQKLQNSFVEKDCLKMNVFILLYFTYKNENLWNDMFEEYLVGRFLLQWNVWTCNQVMARCKIDFSWMNFLSTSSILMDNYFLTFSISKESLGFELCRLMKSYAAWRLHIIDHFVSWWFYVHRWHECQRSL